MAKELTGRKVFLITASAFGVIIAVNLTLAVQAVRTFPGLETKNSYVASQQFEQARAAQLALGWQPEAVIEGGDLVLTLRDQTGQTHRAQTLSVVFGRATHVGEDQVPDFRFDGVSYRAPVQAGSGNWNLRISATAQDGTVFNQRLPLYVRPVR